VNNGYDYVVVGGGSAGCVVAARPSKDQAVWVALIEPGTTDDAPEVHTPIAFPQPLKSEHDWDHSSEQEAGTSHPDAAISHDHLQPAQWADRCLGHRDPPWGRVEHSDPQAGPSDPVTASLAAPGTALRAALYRESGLVRWHISDSRPNNR
jgi:choline dehydrogenase-like flavoprotein